MHVKFMQLVCRRRSTFLDPKFSFDTIFLIKAIEIALLMLVILAQCWVVLAKLRPFVAWLSYRIEFKTTIYFCTFRRLLDNGR